MSDVSPLISHVTDSVVGHENLVSDAEALHVVGGLAGPERLGANGESLQGEFTGHGRVVR